MAKKIKKITKPVKKRKNVLTEREIAIIAKELVNKQKDINIMLDMVEKRERQIKKAEADIEASRDFLMQKENMLNNKLNELKEKDDFMSNVDLSKISEEGIIDEVYGKVSSKFIRDVLSKNIELNKKEKEMQEQIMSMEIREKDLHAEVDNVLKIIDEVQR